MTRPPPNANGDKSIQMPDKAEEVLARISYSDRVVSLEDYNDGDNYFNSEEPYLIGYEDEDGKECDKDGNYL